MNTTNTTSSGGEKVVFLGKQAKLALLLFALIGGFYLSGSSAEGAGYGIGSTLIPLVLLLLVEQCLKIKMSLVRNTFVVILSLLFGISISSLLSAILDITDGAGLLVGLITAIVLAGYALKGAKLDTKA